MSLQVYGFCKLRLDLCVISHLLIQCFMMRVVFFGAVGNDVSQIKKSYSTPGLVSTGMGDRIGVQLLVREIYLSSTNHPG